MTKSLTNPEHQSRTWYEAGKYLFTAFFASAVFFSAFSFANADITTGLVGHWKFDETSGTTASDASGNGNTGTLTNGPAWTTGKVGGALSFDGVDDEVNTGSASVLDDLRPMTASFWINPTVVASPDIILSKDTAGAAGCSSVGGWCINIISGSNKRLQFTADWTSGDPTANWNNVILPNEWQHIVITWNGNNNSSGTDIQLYRNSSIAAINTTTIGGTPKSDANLDLIIGDASLSGYTGLIDDVRIYNRALTQADITELYAYTGGTTSPPPQPPLPPQPPPPPPPTGTWQETLNSNFDFGETFDNLPDWQGSDSGNVYYDGPGNNWDYYSMWQSPDINANWIANHGSSNVWRGAGKSLRMDLSEDSPNKGPSRFGRYFGSGTANSGYSEVNIFWMTKFPANYFPSSGSSYDYYSYYKLGAFSTGYESVDQYDSSAPDYRAPYGRDYFVPSVSVHNYGSPCSGGSMSNHIRMKSRWSQYPGTSVEDWTDNGPCSSFGSGEWFGIEYYLKTGTPGLSDGHITVWLYDDQGNTIQIWSEDRNILLPGHNYKWNKFFFGGNKSWRDADYPNLNQNYYVDDFIIDNQRIGPKYFSLLNGTAPPPPPPPLTGDLNKDGTVNTLDWSIMNSAWGSSNTQADINNDGIVNTIDFSIMNKDWGR